MSAMNENCFRQVFCDIFLQHVKNPFQKWSTESDEYRSTNIGVTFATCVILWEMLDDDHKLTNKSAQPQHLFWALCFLCVYPPWYVLCCLMGASKTSSEKGLVLCGSYC
jgi:hypothetical protein